MARRIKRHQKHPPELLVTDVQEQDGFRWQSAYRTPEDLALAEELPDDEPRRVAVYKLDRYVIVRRSTTVVKS